MTLEWTGHHRFPVCVVKSLPATQGQRCSIYLTHHDVSMSAKHELERMKQGWEKHGISSRFSKVHHFSSGKFATKPPSLNRFYNWCKDRDILDENCQTVKRANRVIALIEDGKSIDVAVSHA